MPTPQPVDARASAWIGAHERIAAAQKLKVDGEHRVVDPLPELYWATLAEAAVLAELARADQTVGLHAGGYPVDQQERIEESRSSVRRLVHEAAARSRDARHPHRAAGDELVGEDQGDGNVPTPTTEPRRDWCCGTPMTKPHTPGCSFEPREDNAIDYSGVMRDLE
ncbi:hypothetical protein QEH38_gp47 [Mycobacterium phage LilSpotty]|uniref:Uncharacterized protein n=1 Tax=Mycobacterium phage LilSpotty TaxID=2588512 RepID=A0A4Y6EV27_9CAUD|nr:hypothetical protein QEH38_gp47 [Mycobacterium phage LilSpotty]QDF19779.1 hypothetical protein SEA_LILSPOTTY_47 [Mycobacterium phage LilSpotty]